MMEKTLVSKVATNIDSGPIVECKCMGAADYHLTNTLVIWHSWAIPDTDWTRQATISYQTN